MKAPSPSLPSSNPVVGQYQSLIASLGRAALHSLFPNDFEYYICSLELVNSAGKTVDFFAFPVMPKQMTQQENKIVNIRKTAGGITTLNTTTFEPIDIILNGNFGRRLRILIGGKEEDFAGIRFSTKSGSYTRQSIAGGLTQIKNAVFNSRIKTGYGCIKILQSIFQKANAVDDTGNPFKLYFYNPALGDNFLVKPINLQLSQNEQENMIWNYNLQLKAIAPLDGVSNLRNDGSLSKTLQASLLGKAANNLATNLKNGVLSNVTPR